MWIFRFLSLRLVLERVPQGKRHAALKETPVAQLLLVFFGSNILIPYFLFARTVSKKQVPCD